MISLPHFSQCLSFCSPHPHPIPSQTVKVASWLFLPPRIQPDHKLFWICRTYPNQPLLQFDFVLYWNPPKPSFLPPIAIGLMLSSQFPHYPCPSPFVPCYTEPFSPPPQWIESPLLSPKPVTLRSANPFHRYSSPRSSAFPRKP